MRGLRLMLEGFTVYLGRRRVVDGVDLALRTGMHVIAGPNGAGKSSLLRGLVGVLPYRGRILWDGSRVDPRQAGYRARVGYLPQAFAVPGHWRVDRFLAYLASLREVPPAWCRQRVADVAALCGIDALLPRTGRSLSGGEQRQVGIAQALLGDPDLLLLDEPFAELDPAQRRRMAGLLADLARERIVVVTSHVGADVASWSGTLIALRGGRVTEVDAIERVLGSERDPEGALAAFIEG